MVTIARPATPPGENRCEYVIHQAGHTFDGRPVALGGYGDVTKICGQFGSPIPHSFHVKRPGTTAVYDTIIGTTFRCPTHKE